MNKNYIKIGYTNKTKYVADKTFVLEKDYNGFNHRIDYSQLKEFDFVPQLIQDEKEEVKWAFIEGEMLEKPSDEDLKKLAKMIRELHKSEVKFPNNNLRKRVMAYLKILKERSIRVPEIDDNYREMTKLLSRMGKLNPCHNDLWYQNIIKDKNQELWLVDWEYSTMGDKHFDLAFFIESYRLNKEQEKLFLDQYNSYDDYNAYIVEWLPKYKRFVAWLTLLWTYSRDKMPFEVQWIKDKLNKKS